MCVFRWTVLCMLGAMVTTVRVAGQDRSYGRSVVSNQNGIVATTWVQASQAGARVL